MAAIEATEVLITPSLIVRGGRGVEDMGQGGFSYQDLVNAIYGPGGGA